MNNIILQGVLKDIEHSHEIDTINFDRAKLIVDRKNGNQDVINLRFKSFSNKYKENDRITITGNVRSYSYPVSEHKNKVVIYVFTYFDDPQLENLESNNQVTIDGRICKMNELRKNKSSKDNLHFILANNIISNDKTKRLNSYIPCIAWGKLAKELSELTVNTQVKLLGELHSREHRKIHEDGEVEFRVAHELLVTDYEVVG